MARRTTDVGNPWLDAGIVACRRLDGTPTATPGASGIRRLGERVVPGPVPQLVLRAADRIDGHDGRGALPDPLRLRLAPRRARRGDAQVQGQLDPDPVRRGRRAHRRRRHAAGCAVREPGGQPPLRLRAGARGRAPLLPAALEQLRLLCDLREARRLDARPARGASSGLAPCSTAGSSPASTRWSARSARSSTSTTPWTRRGRSRASSTTCRTGTCGATAVASGRASSTPTSERRTRPSTRCSRPTSCSRRSCRTWPTRCGTTSWAQWPPRRPTCT